MWVVRILNVVSETTSTAPPLESFVVSTTRRRKKTTRALRGSLYKTYGVDLVLRKYYSTIIWVSSFDVFDLILFVFACICLMNLKNFVSRHNACFQVCSRGAAHPYSGTSASGANP